MRAPDGEALTREMWQTFADRLEEQLGFDNQPRAVAFHHAADGESHMHIAWSRIDLDTMTVIDPGLYKNKMKQLCREFEREYGLTQVPNERGADVRTRSANRAEFEQSRRLDTDLNAIRNAIHDCWRSADSGRAFASALDEAGLILARGDRRDFVVIDREGGEHALSKRITGATAAETRNFMADIDRASLPGVDEAKALQHDRPDPTPPEPQQPRRKQAMSETEEATAPAPMMDDAPARQRDRLVREAAQLAEAERVQAQMPNARQYREQMEREAEEAKKAEQERQKKDADRAAAGDMADAKSRYAEALGSTYTIRDPYGSLANAAMVEYASFHRQQDALRLEAAAEKDPDKRRLIELRREIEGHDYMAITSDRLAGISRAITMGDNPSAQRDTAMAQTHTKLSAEKREQRAELQRELQQRAKDERTAAEQGGTRAPRPRSPAEAALVKAAGERRAAPAKDAVVEAARVAQQEQNKQREGLRPDQPIEGAPPTKELREISAAEKALRSAASSSFREPADGTRDKGRQQDRTTSGRGGGRGR